MSEPKTLQITLQPDGVAAPLQNVVAVTTEAVGTCLRALDNDDCAEQEAWGEPWGYRFKGLNLSPEDRRETFKNWVLAKGFQDLARGVRETLEEAVFYLRMLRRKSGVLTTITQVEADMAQLRAEAAKLPFPALMEKVNAGLREPMAFDAEFRSLQKVRNCLEHRGGRVASKDIDAATGKLILAFPRLKTFYMRGDEEVELVVGEVIDTYSPENPSGGVEKVSVYMRRVTRSREYSLGEPVVVSGRDFFEIALACHMFAGDVASKLPVLQSAENGESGG